MSDAKCPRNRSDCMPHELMQSKCKTTFVCTGFNDGSTREHKQDIFTHCWKTKDTDELNHMDERDFIHTIFVMSSALAEYANIKALEDE